MTIPAPAVLCCAILAALAPAPLRAQDAPVKLTGRCERLVIDGQDITQTCNEQLVSFAARGRASFDFSARDGQFVSFSGVGAEVGAAGKPMPVTLVVPGRKEKDAILRSPAPGSGTCTLSTPEAGKTRIACEASAQGKTYGGTFVTDQPLPGGAGRP